MLVEPKRVVFKERSDIVDYITMGFLPPPEEYFHQVMRKVRNPDPDDESSRKKVGKEVVITEDVIHEEDRDTVESVMKRVYYNRMRNCNKFLVGLGAVALVLTGQAARRKKKNKKREKEMMNYITYLEEEVYHNS